MILDEKIISEKILDILKNKSEINKIRYKYIKSKDIERVIRYFVKTIMRFVKLGYSVNLPVHRVYQKKMNIYITPKEREIVTRQFRMVTRRSNYRFYVDTSRSEKLSNDKK
jgi:broad specificity polyphosphatase/5'/3'-nucleotidase SurE